MNVNEWWNASAEQIASLLARRRTQKKILPTFPHCSISIYFIFIGRACVEVIWMEDIAGVGGDWKGKFPGTIFFWSKILLFEFSLRMDDSSSGSHISSVDVCVLLPQNIPMHLAPILSCWRTSGVERQVQGFSERRSETFWTYRKRFLESGAFVA